MTEQAETSTAPCSTSCSFDCKLAIGMAHAVGIPLVCSLGLADLVPGALISWPSGIVDAYHQSLCAVMVRVSYDEGLCAHIVLEPTALLEGRFSHDELEASVCVRLRAWEKALGVAQLKTAALTPVLNDIFDKLDLMGEEVEAYLNDGQVFAKGLLQGLDLWGKITLNVDGNELELAPEQAGIRAASTN